MAGVVVYSSARATLYLGKAEDVLPTVERGSADLVIADPPYGAAFRSNRGQNFDRLPNDVAGFDPLPVIVECVRALRCRRHLYVFGPLDLARLEQVSATAELVWDKAHLGMGNLSSPWGPGHERIAFGVIAKAPSRRAEGGGRLSARMRHGSVIRAIRPNALAVRRHPTEKPVTLLRQLVESSSIVGDLVLDPFAGVASAGVAALLSGRRYIGVELDERYVTIGAERLAKADQLYDLAAEV